MKQFEIGKTYTMKSAADHDGGWIYIVTARTAKTVTLTDGKETNKYRINPAYSALADAETILPLGKYAKCPILTA